MSQIVNSSENISYFPNVIPQRLRQLEFKQYGDNYYCWFGLNLKLNVIVCEQPNTNYQRIVFVKLKQFYFRFYIREHLLKN